MTLVCKSVGIGDGIVNPILGVGLKWPQILTLYMLGWKGLVLGIPKMYHMLI